LLQHSLDDPAALTWPGQRWDTIQTLRHGRIDTGSETVKQRYNMSDKAGLRLNSWKEAVASRGLILEDQANQLTPHPDLLAETLNTAMNHVRGEWPDSYSPLEALQRLCRRLHESRFHLAVLGQFKRGKSTFINALLGEAVLPVAVLPLTAIATFIAWGAMPMLRVTYRDDRAPEDVHPRDIADIQEALHPFVTEDGNPNNMRGVVRVEVFLPADILHDGVVLIDTPGIGSTLRHNTDTALQVLPDCDAALFVVSADPPITEAELAYLAKVRTHVVHLFFILNKIDYLAAPERGQVEAFLRNAVSQGATASWDAKIFQVSARQALAAKVGADAPALTASGLPPVEREIIAYLAQQKAASLRISVTRKTGDILDHVLSDLGLKIRALELPLADLEQRQGRFEEAVRAFEAERKVARDLLAGDRSRAVAELETQAEALRQDGWHHVMAAVERVIAENGGQFDQPKVHRAIAEAIPVFFERKLTEVASAFRRSVEAILGTHQTRSDALVASVRRTAADLFDVPFRMALEPEPFRLGREPYWVTQEIRELLMPNPAQVVSRFLPASMQARRLRQQTEVEVATLIQRNVENLRWATLQGLNETFRRFAARLDSDLAEGLALTRDVIAAALTRRRTHANETQADLARLQALREHLQACRDALAAQPTAVS
jgi:GTP-binding protein EngB required for normal cell division